MDLANEIEKLHKLREQGALTEEEFAKAKEALLSSQSGGWKSKITAPSNPFRILHRSKQNRWVAGVCAGLAEKTPVPLWVWRLAFVLLGLLDGLGVIAYIVLWALVPERQEK